MVTEAISRPTLSLGGVLTGEPGSGGTRREYVPLALEEPQTEIMRRVREAFDHHRVLNAGKGFPWGW
ncbi:MAG: FAD-linked oxidase C-terminal domain-containing protein [Anaerolineae bacterium]